MMTEEQVIKWRSTVTVAQDVAARDLFKRYDTVFDISKWNLKPFDLPEGFVTGFVGKHICVGISREGEISS